MRHGRNDVGMKENKYKEQWNKHTRAGAPSTCTQPIQERQAYNQGSQRVWCGGGGKIVYFGFPTVTPFMENALLGWHFAQKKQQMAGPPNACHRGRQREIQVLIHSGKEGEAYSKNKQTKSFSWDGQWKKENALGLPIGGNGRATNGLMDSLEGMPIINQKQLVKSQG